MRAHGGYYFLNVNKALAFDTTLPFGLNQRQHNAWFIKGGLELLRDLFAQYNMVNFRWATPAPRWVAGTTRKSARWTTSRV